MQRVVPDASVILKWVLPAERESHVTQALALLDAFARDEVMFLVPPLWLYEVGNTVARQLPGKADDVMGDLLALQMDEPPSDVDLVAEAIRLVASYGVTFYDAAYHALAITQDAVLISADDRYLRAVAPESHAMTLAAWC